MSSYKKSPEAIQRIREAAKITASIFKTLDSIVKEGVTTNEINACVEEYCLKVGATPAPLEKGFPKAVCTSVNEVVCHGVPNDIPLKKGDIINIDVSLNKDGAYGDTSKMYKIGPVAPYASRLIDLTQQSLYLAIRAIQPGLPLNIIGQTIEKFIHGHRLSIVREFCGHGIGLQLHEHPQILHYRSNEHASVKLEPGMIFTIEPMINLGTPDIRILKDGWTVVTKDRMLSAQWEHMILVTENGAEVLTLRDEEHF